MTLQELFGFDENDLYFNRSGRLSPTQQARWEKLLKSGRRWQRGGILVIALALGGTLLGSMRYIAPEMPPEIFTWVKAAGILMIAFPTLVAVRGALSTSRRFQGFEARLEAGRVERCAGHVQVTRVFGGDEGDGYVYTLSINGRELRISGANKLDEEAFSRAVFALFDPPLPPKQNMIQRMRHVPQTVESREAYVVYCLADGWGYWLALSIEPAEGEG